MNPRGDRSRRALLLAGLAALLLPGCASLGRGEGEDAPLLRLSPASLGRELALGQRLRIEARGQWRTLDAVLEADARSLQLALLQWGQTVARLQWDGQALAQWKAPGWPDAVSAERVLADLQLIWWPADAVRAALPAGWSLDERPGVRELRQGGRTAVTVLHPAPGRVELIHGAAGYHLVLDSVDTGATPGAPDGPGAAP